MVAEICVDSLWLSTIIIYGRVGNTHVDTYACYCCSILNLFTKNLLNYDDYVCTPQPPSLELSSCYRLLSSEVLSFLNVLQPITITTITKTPKTMKTSTAAESNNKPLFIPAK